LQVKLAARFGNMWHLAKFCISGLQLSMD